LTTIAELTPTETLRATVSRRIKSIGSFAEYAGGLPLVAFNLEYDLDQVLKPEWKRLGVGAIGRRGFCALRADAAAGSIPSPRQLQVATLRRYYRLPNAARTRCWATCKRSRT